MKLRNQPKQLLTLILLAGVAFSSGNLAVAENPACATSVLATAGLLANTTNRVGSLKYESSRLVSEQIGRIKNNPLEQRNFELKVTPSVFLKSYSDQAFCAEQLKTTETTPLKFEKQTFKTIESLNAWIADFTQGKGELGKLLYEQCPRSCSPRFQFKIEVDVMDQFTVSAEATCGHARDKSDNNYFIGLASSNCEVK